MTARDPDLHAMEVPESQLERALIEQYLQSQGYDLHALAQLPEAQALQLMKDASRYAGAKLAEVEARAHFLHQIHGEE